MNLDTPISQLPGIGSIILVRLKRLKINTVRDLLFHLPFRYENLGQTRQIADITLGQTASIAGEVIESRNLRTKYGKLLTKVIVNDGSSSIDAVWFNQPFITKNVKPKSKISLAGKVSLFSARPTLVNPDYEVASLKNEVFFNTTGLVPIYPETSGLTSKWFRRKIREVLPMLYPKISEIFPTQILEKHKLTSLKKSLWLAHFPKKEADITEGRRRLAFDEFIFVHLSALQRKREWETKRKAAKLIVPGEKILQLISGLPFDLTRAQKRVLKEILNDLQKEVPMNRLLQGDVGSGKTIVAAICAYVAFLNGFATVLMAPTEILTFQHLKTMRAVLEPLGVRVGIRTSSKKSDGKFDVLVGTHSLLSKFAVLGKAALVIIDEQHRFGVEQRAILRQKGGHPHLLTMTATPIPRSLALTLYGNLDISIIDEMPTGRKQVKTYLVPPEKRPGAYEFIRKHIKKGDQAFIIFPLIEPSETLSTVKAAVQEFETLRKEIFPDLSLGLLHGRLKSKEKEKIINEFVKKDLNIIVSTPVVEVGIDIPNASIMMIEGAERFGLASLHQLRGRVGRGSHQSFCLLFTESSSNLVTKRLKALEKYNQGLKLAEEDLKLRGPGQIYGIAQSGLPQFKTASLNDLDLIQTTKREAVYLADQINSGHLPDLKSFVENQNLISPD